MVDPASHRPQLTGVRLTDPRIHAQPDVRAMWTELRATTPVVWHPASEAASGFWVVTRYADALSVYRSPQLYASGRGNVLDTLTGGSDSGAGVMLPVTDGARHAAIRRVVLRGFASHALAPVVEAVRGTVRQLVDEAVEAGECDFGELAGRLPLAAVCGMLGAPNEDHPHLLGLTRSVLGAPIPDRPHVDARVARTELLAYFAELAARRRKDPRTDIISLLVHCHIDGEPLSEIEVVMNCYSIVFGGEETTRLSMTGGILAMMEHPDQWARLKRGEVTVASAVEEVLRWTSAAMHLGRTATATTMLGGQEIQPNETVTVWNISANFDGEVFTDPELFDLGRSPNRHLTFGYGAHFCPGAMLARAELHALLEQLRATVARVEPDGPVTPIYSTFLHGVDSMRVRLVPEPGTDHRDDTAGLVASRE